MAIRKLIRPDMNEIKKDTPARSLRRKQSPPEQTNAEEFYYLKQMAGFKAGSMSAGTTWQVVANAAKGEKTPVEVVLPKEGSTGWSDTWMIASKAANPNCMYLWMNYIISPAGNAAATEYFGEAPSNPKACDLTTAKDHCTTFHAGDEDYFSKIWYWTTPVKECLDGRGTICTDYAEWTKVWTEVKG